jgi:hypothetical protein
VSRRACRLGWLSPGDCRDDTSVDHRLQRRVGWSYTATAAASNFAGTLMYWRRSTGKRRTARSRGSKSRSSSERPSEPPPYSLAAEMMYFLTRQKPYRGLTRLACEFGLERGKPRAGRSCSRLLSSRSRFPMMKRLARPLASSSRRVSWRPALTLSVGILREG